MHRGLPAGDFDEHLRTKKAFGEARQLARGVLSSFGTMETQVAGRTSTARAERAVPAVAMRDEAAARLEARCAQRVDPRRSIAIKRDVHVFEVGASPDAFARAFAAVMAHPESTFGVVRIKRPRHRVGRDFEVGERFQGGFSVDLAVDAWLFGSPLARVARAILRLPLVAAIVERIEDHAMSNYGEVQRAGRAESGLGHTLHYGYLEGTPIAGGSTFTVEPLGEGRCLVTQMFEYQEMGTLALEAFQRFGLKLHDRAVCWQIERAARALGASVRRSTVPGEYMGSDLETQEER